MNTINTKAAVSAITLAFGASVTKGQLAFASSIAFETLPLIAANPKFKFAQFARDVEEASNYSISARTVANCATLASQFQLKFGAKIGSYDGGHTMDNVSDFCSFIEEQTKDTTYRLTLEDLIAFCQGNPSAQAKREAADKARQEAADALAKVAADKAQAELTAQADKAQADADKAKADAEALAADAANQARLAQEQADKEAAQKAQAVKVSESLREETAKAQAAQAEAEAQAATIRAELEAERKQAESFAIMVRVTADFKPDVIFGLNQSPEFLIAAAKIISDAAKAMQKQQKLAMAA